MSLQRPVLPLRMDPITTFSASAARAASEAARQQWEQWSPWWRRGLARIGLQGKLILFFTLLLTLAIGASCWLFASQSSRRISEIMGEQARQLSYALSLASKPYLEADQTGDLRRIGQDLLKTRNILLVAFFDKQGKPIVVASRDPEVTEVSMSFPRYNMQGLMQVHAETSAVLGNYVAVMSPVLSITSAPTRLSTPPTNGSTTPAVPGPIVLPSDHGTRLLGYVVVGVSQAREKSMLARINYLIMGVGCVLVVISLPLAYALVHRIFLPIRQLVSATERIAAGDLGTQVAIHRPDAIGTLARSFNEMVRRVKSQQEALERANTELEQKVRDRTQQLETANWRLSSEIAEKEDFLRAVSHDLNAPLRNISGMATMLLMKNRDKFDEDVIHRLERIQKNVEVETDLIAELLELSRLKTRRHQIETVDVDAMVRDLAGVFENDLKVRNIELLIDNTLPVMACERARFRQVFQNLIDNAVKYMGDPQPGKPREIRVGCSTAPDGVEFYVRDTGIGIEPEDLGRVFGVFRRGRNAAASGVAGKGVGLASVKSIVEMYTGSIRVESRVGEGTVFRFTINAKHLPSDERTGSVEGPIRPTPMAA